MKDLKSICIDIDGTLTDPYFFIPILNEILGMSLTQDDYTSINWNDTYGPEHSQMYKTFDTEYSYVYDKPVLQKGAKEVIDWLINKGLDVHYVTARSSEIHDITAAWVKKVGLDPEKLISLSGNGAKVDTAKKLNCDLFIEDDPTNVVNLSKAGIDVIVLDCNYNKGIEGPRIKRLFSWNEIGEYLKNNIK